MLAEKLRAAFTAGGFTGRRCVVCLPRTDVHMQAVRLPRMPEPELRQAAVWEASERFMLDAGTFEVDIIPTGAMLASSGAGQAGAAGRGRSPSADQGSASSGGREEVLLIACSHQVIHAWLRPILDAGLRPVAIDTHFGALARFFSRQYRRASDRQHVRAIIEIGYTGSTVLILRGDQIAFCKLITIGGRDLNHAVADHLQLDQRQAAELRAARRQGDKSAGPHVHKSTALGTQNAERRNEIKPSTCSDPDAATERAIFEATRPLLGELVKEVTLCLRYYGVTFRGRPCAQIVLTGGESLEPHLPEMLAAACKLPVAHDDEQQTLGRVIHSIQRTLHREPGPPAGWTVAAGLSVREMTRSLLGSWTRGTFETSGGRHAERGSQPPAVDHAKHPAKSPLPKPVSAKRAEKRKAA